MELVGYVNLQDVMDRPINWSLISDYYDEMVKHAAALFVGTAEVEEVLNVIENWNSGNNFIFFGKRGIISSNDDIEQELSILGLHLQQSSLTYINTLMIQQILKKEEWLHRLTIEDKRAITPLFYNHINQYGIYKLDMKERLIIEEN